MQKMQFSTSMVVTETAIAPEHLEAEISYTLGKLEIKRVFRIYRNISVIACDLYFRGVSSGVWQQLSLNLPTSQTLKN